ncbi:MAG: DMT family transporter [Desulfobacterales bacterium]|nr:DMT family transporter [Desulfobacterales bacterium]MDJ0887017.1 DMT family transporter [Desulfobacterales bacterium]MDJ0988644.1 DMT family transporter [Desulfobacterales bacterium]
MAAAQGDAGPPVPPLLVLSLGVVAISFGAIFVRLAEAPALVTAAYRVGLASILLAPAACWRSRTELAGIKRRDGVLALLAGFFLALHFATWIASLDYTSVANSVVLVNTNPIWVGLLGPFLTKEPLRRRTVGCILLSVIGAFIIGWGDVATGGMALYGDGLALAGGVCAAFYLLIGRNLRARVSLLAYIMLCYGSAAVFLWMAVLGLGFDFTGFSAATWAAFGGMAVFSQLVGHSSYNWALKWLRTSTVAISLLGEPIGASILAWLLFGEALTVAKLFGGALVLTAIYLIAREEMQSAS